MKSIRDIITEATKPDPNRFPIRSSIGEMVKFLENHGFTKFDFVYRKDMPEYPDLPANIPLFKSVRTKAFFVSDDECTLVFFDNSRHKIDDSNQMFSVSRGRTDGKLSLSFVTIYFDKGHGGGGFETIAGRRASEKTFVQKMFDKFGF